MLDEAQRFDKLYHGIMFVVFVTFAVTHQIGYESTRKQTLISGRTDHAYVDAPEWTNSNNFLEREKVKFEKASTSTIKNKKEMVAM